MANLSLTDYFDRVVCLNLAERKDRKNFVQNQFKQMGLTGIVWHEAVIHPYADMIVQAFNSSKKGAFTKPNEFNCAREHYEIVKQAYLDGCKSVLVMEDDIKFFKGNEKENNAVLKKFLENVPKDWNILRFGGFTTDKNAANLLWIPVDDTKISEYAEDSLACWKEHKFVYLWNTSMYALNRRGMLYYLKSQEQCFQVADMPLWLSGCNSNIVKSYASTIPLVVQEDKDLLSSDIRSKDDDGIDYKNDNAYEALYKIKPELYLSSKQTFAQ